MERHERIRIIANRYPVTVFDSGPAERHDDPIVFLHGLGSSSASTYAPLLETGRLASYRTILIDFPGFGESPFVDSMPGDMETLALVVTNVMETLAPDGATLLGHSMGGSVAVLAASQRPDLVRQLVVADPNLDPHTGSFSSQVVRFSERRFVEHGRDTMVRAMRLAASRGDAAALGFADAVSHANPAALHRAAVSLRADRSPTFREMLASLPMPRLAIRGSTTQGGDATANLPYGVESATIPGAGHVMMVDEPEAFTEIVAGFI